MCLDGAPTLTMQITTVNVVGREIPFDGAFPMSYEDHATSDHVFVRTGTDEGVVGYGEGTALPWFTGETTAGMVEVVERWIAPSVEGRTIHEAMAALAAFDESFPNAPGATSAIDLALLDLEGKRLGTPVADLLGPTVRDSVPLVFVIPALDPAAAAERAATGVESGFRRVKVKADGDVDGDVERINAVLDALPDDGTLRVDANTGWRDVATARRAVAGFESPDRIEYLEQPTAADRPEAMRDLWEETGVRVFADESVHGPGDLECLGERGLVAGCHLKLAKTGSLRGLRHLATVARRHGLSTSPVSAFGTSLEAAANLHLAATLTGMSAGCELCMNLVAEDIAEPAFEFEPVVDVPTDPGLGVGLPDSLFE